MGGYIDVQLRKRGAHLHRSILLLGRLGDSIRARAALLYTQAMLILQERHLGNCILCGWRERERAVNGVR